MRHPFRTTLASTAVVALAFAGAAAASAGDPDPAEQSQAAADQTADTAEDAPLVPEPTVAGYFQTIEDAARACIAVDDGVVNAGSADSRYGTDGCAAAREEYGEDLEDVIASERERARELEAAVTDRP